MKVTKEQIVGFSSSVVICSIIFIVFSYIFLHIKIINRKEKLIDFEAENSKFGTFRIINRQMNNKRLLSKKTINNSGLENMLFVTENLVIMQNNDKVAQVKFTKKEKTKQKLKKIKFFKKSYNKKEKQLKKTINFQLSKILNFNELDRKLEKTTTKSDELINQINEGPKDIKDGILGYFNLEGRFLIDEKLQHPAYNIQEEGCIIVEITVNNQGDVIMAEVRLKGTNIASPYMRYSAVEAAKKTKFNKIKENQNQIGIIIYKYTLK